MLNRITILGSGYFKWFYYSNHFPVCIYTKVSCCNLKHMQFLLINKLLIERQNQAAYIENIASLPGCCLSRASASSEYFFQQEVRCLLIFP